MKNKKQIKKNNKHLTKYINNDFVNYIENLSIKNNISMLDILPYDLIFNMVNLKFERKFFNMFKITCKTIYNKFKTETNETWESVTNITNLLNSGYRNFKLGDYEFFIVNAKLKKYNDIHNFHLYTSDGFIFHIINNIITNIYNGIAIKDYIKINHSYNLKYLKDSNIFSPISRPINVTFID